MGLVLWCVTIPVILVILRKYREYTWGYYKDTKCCQNKVFIVTGGNSGIGKETVKELAKRKARVVMACRDMDKAKEVIKEIRSCVKTGELIPMHLDLESFESIKQFAEDVLKDFPEISVLINNAGISIPYLSKTESGLEKHFAVNHLGHFLLTRLLLNRLKESGPSRIVIVSSMLHEKGTIDFDNLRGEKDQIVEKHINPAYCNSKLANIYFCKQLAENLKDQNVQVFALCPGFCYTDIFRYSSLKWYNYIWFAPVAFFFMRSANQGCQTVLYCALSDEVDGMSGQLFRNCKPYNSTFSFSKSIQEKLWAVSEELTA